MLSDTRIPPQLCPLVIGVTGHRDLLAAEVNELRCRISQFYAEMRQRFPNTPLRVMSSLAEGADRLAATTAIDSGIAVQAVLPMPAPFYKEDFKSAESRAEFDGLCAQAELLELPSASIDPLAPALPGNDRDLLYANAGMFISAHCHILLALWDGVQSNRIGGTSQIIYFQHYDRLPGIAESVPRTSLFLTDDESDLVYCITCSRASSPDQGGQPVTASWFTTDPDLPYATSMPHRYTRVFERTDEYNRDVLARASGTGAAYFPANAEPPATSTQAAAKAILEHFNVADTLANHFQTRVHLALVAIYTLAVMTGLAFILYSELANMDLAIFAFLAFMISGIGLAAVTRRRQWHRKYLDYRVLAEGLRVQYFWAIAGIHGEGHTKFAYDNFLRQRDMELGWIRNVMRVAGTLSDAQPTSLDKEGLRFAIDNWIGSPKKPGQLEYYRQKVSKRSRVSKFTGLVTKVCLWGSVVIALLLALFLKDIGEVEKGGLVIVMGVLALIAGVAGVYTQSKADRELTKQYVFMEHVFANASRRLRSAVDDAERREVLQGLGDAALSEHAEWILIHRERQPEPAGI